jgi:hypothetical protein
VCAAGTTIPYPLPGTHANLKVRYRFKGNFNSEINLVFPFGLASRKDAGGGFGGLVTFNYFWHKPNGGFYLGGGIGYIFQKNYYHYTYYYDSSYWDGSVMVPSYYSEEVYYNSHLLNVGLNIGYKFVLDSGLYFRTGAFAGVGLDFGFDSYYSYLTGGSFVRFYAKPDLTIGYVF